MSNDRQLPSKDHNYPPCIGENGPMTSGDCARWLEAKYSRHHELEDQASAQMIRNQADEIHRLRAIIAGNEAHGNETNARQEKLETALRGLYWDNVDYLTLNHLGGMDNHWMKAAREALGIRGELKAFVHLCAPHGQDWLTCPECAREARPFYRCPDESCPGNHLSPGSVCKPSSEDVGNV